MKLFAVKALGGVTLGAALTLSGAGTAGAVPVAQASTAKPASSIVPAEDPIGEVTAKLLSSTGLPGITPDLGGASLGLPVSSKVLPWHGTCLPAILSEKKTCLPVNGMY